MSLAKGREMLAIPGPSVVPDKVLQAMHRPSPNIYAGELVEVCESLVPDLKRVARTDLHVAMYIGNGHSAWEAALANTLNAGDRILGLANGLFGHGWIEVAKARGIDVEMLDFTRSAPVDPDQVEAVLRADQNHTLRAVILTHVDTSSSVLNDIKAIRKAMDAAGHPALLMVDCIASMGCDRFEMDQWGVDVAIIASQKGLMMVPGMSFVFFNDKAAALRPERVSNFWNWEPRVHPDTFYQYHGGTAPTHHIFGLRAALDLMMGEGMDAIWARHNHLARAIWAACDVWGQEGPMRHNIKHSDHRSCAVTALSIGKPYGTQLRDWCETQAGVTLGIGLGMSDEEDPNADGYFRIGHMGHVSAHMILGTLGSIQAGLQAIGVHYGLGALDAAAAVISAAPVTGQ